MAAAIKAAASAKLLQAGVAGCRKFTTSKLPTFQTVAGLKGMGFFGTAAMEERCLQDNSGKTVLESGAGDMEAAMDEVTHTGIVDLAELARMWETQMDPSSVSLATREKYWRCWRWVLVWAVTHDAGDRILPMSVTTLKGISWEMMCLGCSCHHLNDVWCTIATRHKAFGLPAPMDQPGLRAKLVKAVASRKGQPLSLKLPIGKHHVHQLFALKIDSLRRLRDRNAVILAVLCCMRPSELVALQLCDVWWNYDAEADLRVVGLTAAINVSKRKNDQLRKGHHPRLGSSVNPDRDLVFQLQRMVELGGIKVHEKCVKRAKPALPCKWCPPLFGKMCAKTSAFTGEPISKPMFSDILVKSMAAIGVSTKAFSGVSARKGGLSTALEAGVPEWMLFLQSGHAQDLAARRYVQLNSTKYLYATWAAFDL